MTASSVNQLVIMYTYLSQEVRYLESKTTSVVLALVKQDTIENVSAAYLKFIIKFPKKGHFFTFI